jgi:methionyl aminopeptidase
MRYAGRVNQQAIEWGFSKALPGVSLKQVDESIEWYIRQAGCTPAFKGYQPKGFPSSFPASACISPNDVVVHGVPNDYILEDGDLLTIDVGTEYKGYFVDAARSRVIGNNPRAEILVESTEAILEAQLSVIRDGCDFLTMVETTEAEAKKRGVLIMPQWGGHGIGEKIHMEPFIPSSIDRTKSPLHQRLEEKQYQRQVLTKDQIICIEPVVTFGTSDIIIDEDQWTIRKSDGNLTAHSERCLIVTKDGYELIS